MYYSTTYLSPLGKITLASDGVNLAGLWFVGQKYYGASIPEKMATKIKLLELEAVDMSRLLKNAIVI